MFSDDFSQLDQAFQEAGASGQQLRFLLLHHVGELLQHLLMGRKDSETQLHIPR